MFKARCTLSALLVGIALAGSVHALGLGPVELQSRLSEPLLADIPLYGVNAATLQNVQVRLANREEFSRLGLDYLPDVSRLQLQVLAQERRVVLQIRSAQAIREPMISIAVVAEENGVRVMREFALLFDLPSTEQRREVNVPSTTSVLASPMQNSEEASSGSSALYGPTLAGDTLSSIAMKLAKNQNLPWTVIATALFKLNPQAFIANDPNKLMMATQLTIPTTEQLAIYTAQDWQQLMTDSTKRAANTGALSSSKVTEPLNNSRVTPGSEANQSVPANSEQLNSLLAKNAELKALVAASEARIADLEARILALPPVSTSQPTTPQNTVNPVTPTMSTAAPITLEQATPTGPVEEIIANAKDKPSSISPIITIRDQTVAPVPATTSVSSDAPSEWQEMFWYLIAILGLMGLGTLIWTWREKVSVQKQLLLQRVRYRRDLSTHLPLPETHEHTKSGVEDSSITDRRQLKFQQIQAAVETYIGYKRYDRAEELLQKEISAAKDDLIFRRQLTRLLKTLEHQRVTEEVIAAEQNHSFEQEESKTVVTLINKDPQRSHGH